MSHKCDFSCNHDGVRTTTASASGEAVSEPQPVAYMHRVDLGKSSAPVYSPEQFRSWPLGKKDDIEPYIPLYASPATATTRASNLYTTLRGMHWFDGKLAVIEAKDLPLGIQTYSGEMLDEAIAKHAGIHKEAQPVREVNAIYEVLFADLSGVTSRENLRAIAEKLAQQQS